MTHCQAAILSPLPTAGRFLSFALRAGGDARALLERLGKARLPDGAVVGVGAPLAAAVGVTIEGLRAPAALVGPGASVPSTQGALWVFLGAADPGVALHEARAVCDLVAEELTLEEDVASFVYAGGRDLTGYEDGTENPVDERAREVAIIAGRGPGLDGGSFVSVQRWVHDLSGFQRRTPLERDHVIGRSLADNEELDDAPASAHVKRAAQESFEPAAFLVRRSMPYGDAREQGLYFVAYAATLDPFERILRRMVGLEDGVVDGLFGFSRPVTAAAYFCPPRAGAHLDLSAFTRRAVG